MSVRVLIRGAGDLASGTALRLYRSGMKVIMTETEFPTTIRRTVSFSDAVTNHILFFAVLIEAINILRMVPQCSNSGFNVD